MVYPIIYRVLTIPGGAGFWDPSTVGLELNFSQKKVPGVTRKKNYQKLPESHEGFHEAKDCYISLKAMIRRYGCQPKNRGSFPPKWMVKIMENPMYKWMIWGENYPRFSETFRHASHWAQETPKTPHGLETWRKRGRRIVGEPGCHGNCFSWNCILVMRFAVDGNDIV